MLTDNIKDRLNIIELAKSEGLTLKKQSNRVYKTTCCFHNEKNASLTFYADTNTFNCFACQAHGDAINFYAKRHNLTNREAIKQLASQLGLQTRTRGLKRAYNSDLEAYRPSTSLKSIGDALKGVEKQLKRHQTDPDTIYRALKEFCGELLPEHKIYLTSESRGLTDETIKKFGIFSIKDYKKTKEFLLSKFKLETLQDLVLFNRKQNRFLFTQHKIIIPIIEDGKIKAIRGRYFYKGFSNPDALKLSGVYGKYNSTAGVANTLFNGDILKTLKKGERVYLCEGEFDTMILEQYGKHAVGVLGAGNYDEQLIKRLNDFDLVIAFDNKNYEPQSYKHALKISNIFFKQTGREVIREDLSQHKENPKDITELIIKRQKDEKLQNKN